MRIYVQTVASIFLSILLAGCMAPSAPETPCVVAEFLDHPITIDAKIGSDPAWGKAVEYKLHEANSLESLPPKMAEAIRATKYWTDVWVKILYDQDHLYVRFRVENDDIRAAQQQDQTYLYQQGDCMEVFIKPLHANAYLELYANPSGNKTTFFFPSRSFLYGRFHENQSLIPGLLEVYSNVDGTLNDSSDEDNGWTTVMVINRKVLQNQLGVPFDGKHPWTVLFAGYAYSSHKIYSSYFMYPKLPQPNFHYHEYYARLILTREKTK